jgi:hypothetical protein
MQLLVGLIGVNHFHQWQLTRTPEKRYVDTQYFFFALFPMVVMSFLHDGFA